MLLLLSLDFYPRPPRGGRPLRVEASAASIPDFYPRPPRGGRPPRGISCTRRCRFLSTPSARRATLNVCFRDALRKISIHALREEGDRFEHISARIYTISIHALREEGDDPRSAHRESEKDFYPRPPRGGRLSY